MVVLSGDSNARAAAEEACRRQSAELALAGLSVLFVHADPADVGPLLPGGTEEVMWLRGEAVYDPRLYRRVWESPAPVWVVDRGEKGTGEGAGSLSPIGLAKLDLRSRPSDGPRLGRESLARAMSIEGRPEDRWLHVGDIPTYLPDLRRHLRPYWCQLNDVDSRKRAGRMIVDSAQKGVLDFPARFLHPLPENLCTRWLSGTRVTPNQVTVLTGFVAFGATYLLATQSFGWGLAVAFLVNVLDGVDGKLARVKLLASRFGDRLDHILDVTFEFSWYLGLGWGLYQATGHRLPLQLGVGLIGVMVAARALSGIYRRRSGRQIHDHRRFDRAFRLVAGRRNVYTMILLAGFAAGRIEEAFYLTFGWGVATLCVYIVRTGMTLFTRADESC